MKLTDTACRNAEARSKPFKMSDGEGMHLLIQPTGRKLWRLAYRINGKERTLSLGSYPEMKLKDARDAKTKARAKVAVGIDPMAPALLTGGSAPTFRTLAEEYHEIWREGKARTHVDRVWGRLARDAFPEIGSMPIGEITAPDVLRMVRKVEDRGALDVARRLKQKCSEVFGYAIAAGYATVDPAASIGKALRKSPPVQHMAKVADTQFSKLVRDIQRYELSEISRLGLQWTLLTAVRTSESREAKWSEIEGDLWRIPADRMKMKREHLVPLSKQALDVLKELKTLKRNDYLFPGPRRAMANANFLINALYDLGYRGKQTVHGFRRIFSTTLNENGFNGDWIERQLAHVEENKIRGAYNAAEWLDGRTTMMQWWGEYVEAAGADVTPEFEDLLG